MTNTEQNNGTEKEILPVDREAERAARQDAKDARIRVLRSRAAVARSEVSAVVAMHLDPDTLEEMLLNATPSEAERIRKSEREISVRVLEAGAMADQAEAEYEQALLEQFDETHP
jgi:tRNA(Ser,Leu) C12 N-acetylase TAN1